MIHTNTIDIVICEPYGPYKKGQVIKVETDINQIPYDTYWRARLKDAELDGNCHIKESPSTLEVEVLEKAKPLKAKKPKKPNKKSTTKLTAK